MRRMLMAAVLVAFMPTANAQDKGKSEFSPSGDFRVRDTFEQNESGDSNTKPAHHNGIEQRFKLGTNFKVNEKLSATATLIQSSTWGQPSNDSPMLGDRDRVYGGAGAGTINDEPNILSVNEAYAKWMMSEDFNMKFGRMNFSFGDGSVMDVNDWQQQPYSFDGVTAHYEFEFGKVTAFGFKYYDLSNSGGKATTSDPQHDAYGLVFDLKTMPEWLKMVNVHVIQDAADGIGTSTGKTVGGLQNQNILRYGVGAGFSWGMIDLKADVEMVSGKNTQGDAEATPVATSHTVTESMYQAEVGFNLPAFMSSRFYVKYHQDSGTKQSDSTSVDSPKDKTYDPYFYKKDDGSGLMEIVAWGNLTDISAGWTIKPMDSTEVGLAYHMFSKTEKEDSVKAGVYGGSMFPTGATACSPTNAAGLPQCKTAIGSEIDLWAEHHYDANLSTMLRLGSFAPGDTLKDAAIKKSSTVTQVMVQGKLTF